MLEVKNARKYFGGVRAVDSVSLTIAEGSITGLIGPNGAGKTTLFNLISGFIPLDSGEVLFASEHIEKLPAFRISQKGLCRTFQTPKGFPKMTVLENMLVFAKDSNPGVWSTLLRPRETKELDVQNIKKAMDILNLIELTEKGNIWVDNLSIEDLKLLELVRPLMANPRILLLDEPASGINPGKLSGFMDFIRKLRKAGMTFLIVDHNMEFIMKLCDYIYCMAEGKLVCGGSPDSVSNNEVVIEVYLGKKKAAI